MLFHTYKNICHTCVTQQACSWKPMLAMYLFSDVRHALSSQCLVSNCVQLVIRWWACSQQLKLAPFGPVYHQKFLYVRSLHTTFGYLTWLALSVASLFFGDSVEILSPSLIAKTRVSCRISSQSNIVDFDQPNYFTKHFHTFVSVSALLCVCSPLCILLLCFVVFCLSD